MKSLTIMAVNSNLDQVMDFINGILEEAEFPLKQIMKVDVAVEEIFSNIANYAYEPDPGNVEVKCSIEENGKTRAIIEFNDNGKPYNPLEKEDPNINLTAEEREIGGLGIYMSKKLMDRMEYQYEGGKNILMITKQLD